MRLMVVLGCSKSGGATFGIPLSVGIQCPELVFEVQNPLGVDSSSSESIPRRKNLVLEKEMNEKERNPTGEKERSYISCIVPYPLDRKKSVTRDDITRAEVTSGGLRADDPAYDNSGLPT
ncbi:hypothetical protein PIB30_082277 [Stylosanthes scabra]|uniref:Uncharacterized protein n=1 Tax=Stylosanthes scabra TaxID=79078 RepID=A0ABU6XQ23_9FABA|nr:hypothetical protein [Stylosanthes scabra]